MVSIYNLFKRSALRAKGSAVENLQATKHWSV